MEKNNKLLIILLIVIVLGLSAYIIIDKTNVLGNNEVVGENNNNDIENKQEDNTSTEEQENNNIVEEDTITSDETGATTYYMSSDDKYMLILSEHERTPSNPKLNSNSTSRMFILFIDQYYDNVTVAGFYNIEDNKIELSISAGSLNGCTLDVCKNNVVIENEIQEVMNLDYSEEKIMFGNIELLKK